MKGRYKQMKNRCLILVTKNESKTSKFVNDICDAIIDIGNVPLLPIDANDIKYPDSNVSEMLMESDAVIVVDKDDVPKWYTSGHNRLEDEILETINDAESIGKKIVYIDVYINSYRTPDSLCEYLKKVLNYEM